MSETSACGVVSKDLTYHIRVEGRCKFLGIQVIPVDWREEHVVFDLSLLEEHRRYEGVLSLKYSLR